MIFIHGYQVCTKYLYLFAHDVFSHAAPILISLFSTLYQGMSINVITIHHVPNTADHDLFLFLVTGVSCSQIRFLAHRTYIILFFCAFFPLHGGCPEWVTLASFFPRQ